jgi:hypothetical protein
MKNAAGNRCIFNLRIWDELVLFKVSIVRDLAQQCQSACYFNSLVI